MALRKSGAMAAPIARTGGLNRAKSDMWWGYFFILPQMVGLIAFSLIPLVTVFYLSATDWSGLGAKHFVGLSNYADQLQDPDFLTAIKNTVYYTAIVVPGGLICALVAALGLNRVRGKTVFRVIYFMPVVTSSVAVSIVWLFLLNSDFGLINAYLHQWFGIKGPEWLNSGLVIPSISMMSIWWGLGFNMVIFLAGLQGISVSYYEAAQIDGANKFQQFWAITLPLLSPTTFFVLVMSIISSFQVFDQAFVMTGGGPAKASYTMVFHIYQLAFVNFTFGASAAAAVMLFVIILIFTLCQMYLQRRWVYYG